MKRIVQRVILAAAIGWQAVVAGEQTPEHAQARSAVEKWLSVIDRGDYDESWRTASPQLRAQLDAREWAKVMGEARTSLGPLKSRALREVSGNAEEVTVRYRSEYTATALDEVVVTRKGGSGWEPETYELKP